MATDIAYNFYTGDLIIAPNNDLERRTGVATIEQRVRTRLHIYQGTWSLDTTGQLGSKLYQLLRVPINQAEQTAGLFVREALRPMSEISVIDVGTQVLESLGKRQLDITIKYAVIEPSGKLGGEQEVTTTLMLGGT